MVGVRPLDGVFSVPLHVRSRSRHRVGPDPIGSAAVTVGALSTGRKPRARPGGVSTDQSAPRAKCWRTPTSRPDRGPMPRATSSGFVVADLTGVHGGWCPTSCRHVCGRAIPSRHGWTTSCARRRWQSCNGRRRDREEIALNGPKRHPANRSARRQSFSLVASGGRSRQRSKHICSRLLRMR